MRRKAKKAVKKIVRKRKIRINTVYIYFQPHRRPARFTKYCQIEADHPKAFVSRLILAYAALWSVQKLQASKPISIK